MSSRRSGPTSMTPSGREDAGPQATRHVHRSELHSPSGRQPMRHPGRDPHRARRRNGPGAARGVDDDHTRGRIDELMPVMGMSRSWVPWA